MSRLVQKRGFSSISLGAVKAELSEDALEQMLDQNSLDYGVLAIPYLFPCLHSG